MILQLVIFALFLIGILYSKRRVDIKKHRLFMGLATILQVFAIILIMGRAFFSYVGFLVERFYQATPIVTWAHGITGGLAVVLGIIFLLRHPRKIRLWMRITAVLWVISLALGTFYYAYYYLL